MSGLVRPISSDDLQWMRGLFTRRYPNYFDVETTENWMREVVIKAPIRFRSSRTDDALCITLLSEYPWLPSQREALVVVLLADHGKVWQTLPLLRDSIAWSRRREAALWRFGSDTPEDCAPLMRRLGVPQDTPRYKLDLIRRN